MSTQAFVLDEDELKTNELKSVFGVEHPNKSAAAQRTPRPALDLAPPDQEILLFEGFRAPWYKKIMFAVLGVCTGGLLFLIAKWSLTVRIALRLQRCKLKDAQYVRTTLKDGRISLDEVVVLQPAATASHPYLSAQHHSELLLEAGYALEERLLEFRCSRYFYDDSLDTFLPVPDMPNDFNQQLKSSAVALAATHNPRVLEDHAWQLNERQQRYGSNEMTIPVKGIALLVAEEMWHPFYVFQYFSVIIWIAGDEYYIYSVCIFLITWFSIITSAVETHRNMKRLAELAHYTCMVEVLRGGRFMSLPSTVLVPGDVVAVVTGVLPADCVLLSGECIVDENMLTGESVPVRKVPYQPNVDSGAYDPDKHTSCTLYGGTNVAQARAPGSSFPGMGLSTSAETGGCALAMVVRTRFYSAKGQLLRSILHPRESSESFIGDSLKFITVMLVACMGIFIWAAVVLARMGAEPGRIVVRFLDMITVAVPPALPACLTIAMVFSISRLRKMSIFVTGPHTITVAGRLDAICFDKTGTLTIQGLELQGIVPVSNGRFEPPTIDMQQLPRSIPQLLASCHGLAWLGDMLVGDPLDQKLFAATGWTLIDHPEPDSADKQQQQELAVVHPPGHPQQQLNIVRRFEFSSQLMRNLVVVQLSRSMSSGGGSSMANGAVSGAQQHRSPRPSSTASVSRAGTPSSAHLLDGDAAVGDLLGDPLVGVCHSPSPSSPSGRASHMLYVKGSPEVIKELVQASSVPPDFDAVLADYTREGLRVLALAQGAVLPGVLPEGAVQTYSQQQLEAAVPLQLVGLAVLANPLRPDSADTIRDLQNALIRTAMVTGDHVRTAISVAHQCHILPLGRPVLLVDAPAAPAAAGQPAGRASLSVLYPDGSANSRVTQTPVLAQVMMGELECAVTGKGFDALLQPPYDTDTLQPVLRRACVFARMSPDNKRDLIEMLGAGLQTAPEPGCPHLGLHVGFCGDGANDCGALKAAHVGVSLCEAEASVAAPMTSKRQSISSMISVVSEGRCALLATYQIFQFIVGYAMAQSFATNLMYTHALQMGNYQYLIGDLFYTTILAALMGYTRPCKTLARAKPVSRVMSPPLIITLVLQLVVIIIFQLIALGALHRIPWYTPTRGSLDLRTYVAPETSVIYLTNLAQFVILAVVFNKGHPHRQPLWTNWGLSLALVLQVGFIVYSLFSVDAFTVKVQEIVGKDPPMGLPLSFRVTLLVIFLVNAAVSGGVLLLSLMILKLLDRVRVQPWWQRRLEEQSASAQALLASSSAAPGAAAVSLPASAVQLTGTKAAATGPNRLHVPNLQAPSGAALL